MVGHTGYSWSAACHRFGIVGAFFRCGSSQDLRQLCRCETPGTCTETLCPICHWLKVVVTYGLELMMALFQIVQGIVSTIMQASGLGNNSELVLPDEMIVAIEDCGFFESIPLWAVTLICSLVITILSFIIILSVYGRFFKLYIYNCDCTDPSGSLCR